MCDGFSIETGFIMLYDYELDGMKLLRWNPKTQKSSKINGLFGNAEAAKRAAISDFQKLKNLSKKPLSCRFTANGCPWENLEIDA